MSFLGHQFFSAYFHLKQNSCMIFTAKVTSAEVTYFHNSKNSYTLAKSFKSLILKYPGVPFCNIQPFPHLITSNVGSEVTGYYLSNAIIQSFTSVSAILKSTTHKCVSLYHILRMSTIFLEWNTMTYISSVTLRYDSIPPL